MPTTNLSDHLLQVKGIHDKLIRTKSELANLPPERIQALEEKKLKAIQTSLESIFFETLNDAQIQELLSSSPSVFTPDYAALQNVLRIVFSELTLDEMIAQTSAYLNQQEWAADETILAWHYQRLNQQHGYFQSENNSTQQMALYKNMVCACRKICVLVEKNNTPNDTMAYHYAYTLMALFIDESQPLPSFQMLSKKIDKLLTPRDQTLKAGETPFHDVLIDLKLPDKSHDRAGWASLINKEGRKVLPLFQMAKKIEEKTEMHGAPATLKEAKAMAALCKYSRSAEDERFAQLCYEYKVPEETFNAGLHYMGTVWPKKQTDTIPDITIESPASDYAWTKLPANDKRGLILGNITDCCQSIGDNSSQCVKDAVSLSDNGLYVLLKRKKGTSPCKKTDGTINDNEFQIIGQAYVWKSKTGNLCLDSIECLKDSIQPAPLQVILSTFAEKVLEDNGAIK